jgi:hypothetical protein
VLPIKFITDLFLVIILTSVNLLNKVGKLRRERGSRNKCSVIRLFKIVTQRMISSLLLSLKEVRAKSVITIYVLSGWK